MPAAMGFEANDMVRSETDNTCLRARQMSSPVTPVTAIAISPSSFDVVIIHSHDSSAATGIGHAAISPFVLGSAAATTRAICLHGHDADTWTANTGSRAKESHQPPRLRQVFPLVLCPSSKPTPTARAASAATVIDQR
mmetsp:Transcript_30461/g.64313  ORF Transcript_30461/g.64313 Transcript_30461/m.64313 type:complete len:138 (+) Transcript_30461:81-494(+)